MISASSEFPSLAALREHHQRLLSETRTQRAGRSTIEMFLATATRTGRVLHSRVDRSAAQAILDYWIGKLYATGLGESRSDPVPDAVLEPFDPKAAPDLSAQSCPFKGLSAFRERDAERFFGREESTAELAAKVKQRPMTWIVGPSGSGKSSLVFAGLLPRLKSTGDWFVPTAVIPGNDPLAALLQSACPEGEDRRRWIDGQRAGLTDTPATYRGLLESVADSRPILLIVDQFEELFTLCHDQKIRERFAEAIASLTTSPGAHRVLLTLREDFALTAAQLPALQPFAADPENRFTMPSMTTRELRRVIERPSEAVGLIVDEVVADDLVKEVAGEPAALPLLQFTLLQLWEHREGNRITWDTYRKKVGTPREALKRTADRVYVELLHEDQVAAQHIFQELVQPGVGAEFVRRRIRRDSLSQLLASDRVDRVLDHFGAAGLIREVKGEERGDDRFEVTHEALIRNWPRLAQWLAEKRHRSEKEIQLLATVRLWRESGRKDGYLLHGAALDEAQTFAPSSADIAELVLASRLAQRRRHRWAIGILATLTTVAILCAIIAIVFAVRSTRYANEAKKQEDRAREKAELAIRAQDKAEQEAEKTREANALLEKTNIALRTSTAMMDLIRILGELANSRDRNEHRLHADRLNVFTKFHKKDSLISPFLARHAEEIRRLAQSDSLKDQAKEKELLALTIGRSFRNEALREMPPAKEILTSMRASSFEYADHHASKIVSLLLSGPYAEAALNIREFWILYWGEMGMLENRAVERAMIAFGEQCKKIDGLMKQSLDETSRKVGDPAIKSWQNATNYSGRPSMATANALQKLRMEQQLNPSSSAAVKRLVDEASNLRAPDALVQELQRRQKNLQEALREELNRGPIEPFAEVVKH